MVGESSRQEGTTYEVSLLFWRITTSAIAILPAQEGTLVSRHAHPTNPTRWIRVEPEMSECELLAASPRFRTSFETESPTLVLEDLFRW